MDVIQERRSHLNGRGATGARTRLHAEHADAEIAELKVALKENAVTFHEVARSWFGAHDDKLAPKARHSYRSLFPDLLGRFEKARGGIESDYFCEHIKVAAALTDVDKAAELVSGVNPEQLQDKSRHGLLSRWRSRRTHASASAIYVEPLLGDPSCWESKALLSQALDLHYRALEFLRPEHRKVCMRRIFAAITSLLGTLDNRAAETGKKATLKPAEVERLRKELNDAEMYFQKHAERRAQLAYVTGMLVGIIPLFAMLAAIAWAADVSLDEPVLVSLFAGGIGAIVSVMTRMARGKLVLEREIGQLTAGLLGSVRPFIGAVFGALMFVLIDGNVINIAPGGTNPTFVTYAGLAFVAGFSERVAISVVDSAGDAVTGTREAGNDVPETPSKRTAVSS